MKFIKARSLIPLSKATSVHTGSEENVAQGLPVKHGRLNTHTLSCSLPRNLDHKEYEREEWDQGPESKPRNKQSWDPASSSSKGN